MLEVRDPADVREVVAQVPAMTAAQVAAAYASARAAFGSWRRASPLDRAAILSRAAALVRARAEEGAVTLVRERCTATSRVVADAAVAPALLEMLRAQAEAAVLGPGLSPATTLGPLSAPRHRDDVLEHITRATAEDATVLTGGGRPADAALAHGCYVTPTIIAVSPKHSLWREEVFGPVIAAVDASGLDEAIALANDSAYGLSAAVFTRDIGQAHRFIDLAEAGQVSVNLPTSGWDVHHPFGGFRASGSPFKEQGAPGLRFYTRIKTAAVRFTW